MKEACIFLLIFGVVLLLYGIIMQITKDKWLLPRHWITNPTKEDIKKIGKIVSIIGIVISILCIIGIIFSE